MYIVQFGCGKGVHLPYHLLQLTQYLLSEKLSKKPSKLEQKHKAGMLDNLNMSDVRYLYFTEADQVTSASPDVLHATVGMLNSTTYVAPQRMVMSAGSQFMHSPDFDSSSISDITAKKFLEARRSRRRKLLASRDPFLLENECGVGAGEAGYLGKPDVHFPFQ